MILEVGLGGRLDAVNIVEPDVTIITTIALDHEAWLGTDLVGIAFEKSGICGSHSFNVVGDEKSYELVKQARPSLKIKLAIGEGIDTTALFNRVKDIKINPYKLLFQNILLASVAFKQLFKKQHENLNDSLNESAVIRSIRIKGRFQQISDKPVVIVDVGHNIQAAENLSQQIKGLACSGKRYAICGLMADKAITEFISIMDCVIDEWRFVSLPMDRAAKSHDLLNRFLSLNSTHPAESIDSVAAAYLQLNEKIDDNDHVYAFGSFITVAEMLHYFDKNC